MSAFARSSGFNKLLECTQIAQIAFQSAGDEGVLSLSECVTSLAKKTKPTTDTMNLTQQGCLKQGVNEITGSEEVNSPQRLAESDKLFLSIAADCLLADCDLMLFCNLTLVDSGS